MAAAFELVRSQANPWLYLAGGTEFDKATFAFILNRQLWVADPTPEAIVLADTWAVGTSVKLRGAYCFVPGLQREDVDELVSAVQGFWLPKQFADNYRFLLWLRDPEQAKDGLPEQQLAAANNGRVFSPLDDPSQSYCFRNALLRVEVVKNSTDGPLIALNNSDESQATGFRITSAEGKNQLQLITATSQLSVAVNNDAGVEILLPGEQQGLLRFNVDLLEPYLDALDVGLRYYWQGADPQSPPETQRYPLFNVPSCAPLPLTANLDPWYTLGAQAAARTNYVFRPGFAAIDSYFRTPLGQVVRLTPLASGAAPGVAGDARPPKLKFVPQPAAADSQQPCQQADPEFGKVTLIPAGPFAYSVESVTDVSQLMAGLSGAEFLVAAPGDVVQFVSDQAAFAKGFGQSGRAISLDTDGGQCVTSWLQLAQSADDNDANKIKFGYCVQPASSVYFGEVEGEAYPMAVGARISAQGAELPPAPMAPYGGASFEGLTPTTMPEFENTVLAVARRQRMNNVVDTTLGPRFFNPVLNPKQPGGYSALQGGYATTPGGMLVQLNTGTATDGLAGTWQQLFLAKSPDVSGQELVINPSRRVVNPALANALMNDQLFLVISCKDQVDGLVATNTDPAAAILTMGEFTFTFDIDQPKRSDGQYLNTLLIFKYNTSDSLENLINQTSTWWETAQFIGADVTQVQEQLRSWLEPGDQGKPGDAADPGDALAIEDIKTNKQWTGILAVNAGLDLAKLPIDLQILMGGINGQLRSSYLTINASQIDMDGKSSVWSISSSSLGALIDYECGYTLDYGTTTNPGPVLPNGFGFQVLKLLAQFDNSGLSTFESSIAVTIPRLLEQQVQLQPQYQDQYNAVVIAGTYQQQDGRGAVVFESTTPNCFTFSPPANEKVLRVMNQLVTGDNALVPVSSSGSKSITVKSDFSMAGSFDFTCNVNVGEDAQANNTDLFSYDALGFRNYNLNITTVIEDNMGRLTSIERSLADLQVVASQAEPRDSSLMKSLPFKLLDIEYAKTGIQPDTAIYVDGGKKGDNAYTVPLTSTPPPHFALRYRLSLGGLGALSSVVDALDVELLLGWTPATEESKSDTISLQFIPSQLMSGLRSFAIQGVLDSAFTSIVLSSVNSPADAEARTFVLQFTSVTVEMFGIDLIKRLKGEDVEPQGIVFTLFADPSQGNRGNLGWLLSAHVEPPETAAPASTR